jgi:hypothetical protein
LGFRLRLLGTASTYSRSVLGADGNLEGRRLRRKSSRDAEFAICEKFSVKQSCSFLCKVPGNGCSAARVKLGEAYFVVDGHHRVAVARELGVETIDAEVTEQRAYWQLRAGADETDLILGERHRIFMEASGLGDARPEACISFTLPQGYDQVLESLESHGYRLMRETGKILAPDEVAADWYDRVFLGAIEAVRREGLEPRFQRGDLFLCLQERRRALRARGSEATLEDAARDVLAGDVARTRPRLRRLFAR